MTENIVIHCFYSRNRRSGRTVYIRHTRRLFKDCHSGKTTRRTMKTGTMNTLKKDIMVRLTLASAMIMPLAISARAQPTIACDEQPMKFGRLHNCGGGGQLTITPAGLMVTDGCIKALGTPQEVVCRITTPTPQTQAIKINMTTSSFDLTGPGTMALDNFNIFSKSAGPTITFPSASFTSTQKLIGIGARLNLSPSQAAGSYSGSVNVSITFQ